MKKRWVTIFCLLFLVSLFLYSPLTAKKKDPRALLKGFDRFITQTMEEWKVPGLAISIIKDGTLIFSRGFGYRDVKQGLEVTPPYSFRHRVLHKSFHCGNDGDFG